MNINKNNYEAWFIDYFDGALSAEQVAELLLFLQAHPSLKEEFDAFDAVSLNDFEERVEFPEKKKLKKNAPSIEELMVWYVDGTISEADKKTLLAAIGHNPELNAELERYKKTKLSPEKIVFENKTALKNSAADMELLMCLNVDGTLSETEQQILQDALIKNAALKNEQAIYFKTKLAADASIVFADKASLKREKKGVVIPLYFRYAAAAAIALIVGLTILLGDEGNREAKYISYIKRQYNGTLVKFQNKINDTNEQQESNKYSNKYTPQPSYKKQIKRIVTDTAVIDNRANDDKKEQLVKVNTMDGSADSAYNKMVLVNNLDFEPDEDGVTTANPDYLTWKELMALKVKEKMLPEQIENSESTASNKKFTWYDLALIGVKGINKILKNDIELKKRTDEKGTVVAYQFVTPKNEYNFPVK